jgi:RNA polymerase sigma factor (TIGR02999 family)
MITRDDVTQLLADLNAGDPGAMDKIVPLVYDELRTLANRALRTERCDHTLQTTALVHEAYMRLTGQRTPHWQDRAHFFAIAARMMRRILVDHARARSAAKRGSPSDKVELDDRALAAGEPNLDLAALDEALSRLAQFDAQQGRIVELRFFGGLTIDETAQVVGVSPATVKREWTVAKAWLHREVSRRDPDD